MSEIKPETCNSPIPWAADKTCVRDDNGNPVSLYEFRDHIVLAVNSHAPLTESNAKMREALKDVADAIIGHDERPPGTFTACGMEFPMLFDRIALALASPESGEGEQR